MRKSPESSSELPSTDYWSKGMHYASDGEPVLPHGSGEPPLRKRIEREVIEEIPQETWLEADRPLPFQYDLSPSAIILECLPHCNGRNATNAVYVLECFHTRDHQNVAIQHLQKTVRQWVGSVNQSRRVLYVGKTIKLIKRLDQHLNDPGSGGAEFTTVFPPVRVLNVTWYSTKQEMDRAEPLTAQLLRNRFAEDYVSQPG